METTTGPAETVRRVVVGVDGSPGARAALAWAFREAAAREATVQVLAAFPVDFYWTDVYLADPRHVDAVRADTDARATTLVTEARGALEGEPAATVPAEIVVVPGPAAEQLVHAARGAELLVVGSRGRSAVRSTLLGSVALHAVTHAPCPVVVVHPGAPAGPPRVVAGLDETPVARVALAAAAQEARRLGAELHVVAAYLRPDPWSDLYGTVVLAEDPTHGQAEQRARRIVDEVLAGCGGAPSVRLEVVEGPPGEALVTAAAGASLLVVGSRSRSRLEGMVLGSVALHSVVAASCPVLVVHPDRSSRNGTVRPVAGVAAVS